MDDLQKRIQELVEKNIIDLSSVNVTKIVLEMKKELAL